MATSPRLRAAPASNFGENSENLAPPPTGWALSGFIKSQVSGTGGYTTYGVAVLQTSPKMGRGDPSKHASPEARLPREPRNLLS